MYAKFAFSILLLQFNREGESPMFRVFQRAHQDCRPKLQKSKMWLHIILFILSSFLFGTSSRVLAHPLNDLVKNEQNRNK